MRNFIYLLNSKHVTVTPLALLALLSMSSCKVNDVLTELKASYPSASQFIVDQATDTSISFSWTDNASGELIYSVEKCSGAGCTDFAPVARSPYPADANTHAETGLTAHSVYRFRVRAEGALEAAAWLSSGDIQTQLQAGSSFSYGSLAHNSLTLAWSDNSSSESGFEVQRCTGAACTNFQSLLDSPVAANTTTYNAQGLSEGVTYRFRVRAISTDNTSDWLEGADITTPPAAPTAFALVDSSSTSLSLSWDDNSSVESAYEIQSCLGATCTNFAPLVDSPLAGDSVAHMETGLSAESVYRFRVRAVSAGGSSLWLISNFSTKLAPPTSLLTSSVLDRSISLSWVDAATSELAYEVERCIGTSCTTYSPSAGSPLPANTIVYTDTGVSPSSTYRYRVRAIKLSGASDWVNTSDILSAPDAPTSLVIGSVTQNSVALSWNENASDESAIEVQSCLNPGCSSFSAVASSPLAANSTSVTVSSLSSNSTYRFRIRATRSGTSSSWLNSGDILTSVAPVVASTCSSPITKVIDRGTKGSVLSVGRGLWSDTKIQSLTGYPAIAYYDGSSTGGTGTIKYSYWDGSKFNVEHVASDSVVSAGSASFVKLGFLNVGANQGRPIIVWTNGSTQLKAAMRSTASPSAGTWSAAVIDTVTGAATRSAEISISPADHIAITYVSNTTTTGRMRFSFCDAPCTSLTGFTGNTMAGPVPGATDTIENAAVVAATVGTGLGWCKHNSTTYFPVVTYPSGTSLKVASCQGSLSSCKTSSGWSSTSAVVVGTTSTLSRLQTDSTLTGDTIRIIHKPAAATALTPYSTTSACNVAGAPTVSAAGAVIGTTTAATAWASLMRDAGGLFHVVANDAAASVAYMNSNTSNIVSTTWNAAGTIESGTGLLPAVGAGAGGADLNSSTAQVLASYGLNIAPFNINLGVVNDITIPSNNAAAGYYSVIADTSGNIALPTAAGPHARNVSSSATSTDLPASAYVDHSIGGVAGARLKYAMRSGTSAASSWSISTIPGTSNPTFPSLAFDHNDLPWISYYDASNFRYYVVTNSQTDGQGLWTSYQVPIGAKTASAAAPATDDTSIAMYYVSGVAQPLVIFMNSTAAGGTGVRAVRLNPTTGQFGTVSTIDSLSTSFGTRLTSAFDRNGNIVIAYYDITTTTVKFNRSSNGGATWFPASPQISALTQGREGLSVQINPATGRPAVSYYERANNNLYYVRCTTALNSCNNVGNWTGASTPIVSGASALGISGVAATANEQLLNTSLTFNGSGSASVAYIAGGSAAAPGLYLTDNSTGSFVSTALRPTGTPGTLSGAAANNFGLVGFHASSIRTGDGHFTSVYVGPNNWLYATSCED